MTHEQFLEFSQDFAGHANRKNDIQEVLRDARRQVTRDLFGQWSGMCSANSCGPAPKNRRVGRTMVFDVYVLIRFSVQDFYREIDLVRV